MLGFFVLGILLGASGVGIAYFLQQFKFVKENEIAFYLTYANPGAVGVLAGLAFLFKPFAKGFSDMMLYGSMGLVIITLPIIALVIPKILRDDLMAKAKEADQEPEKKD